MGGPAKGSQRDLKEGKVSALLPRYGSSKSKPLRSSDTSSRVSSRCGEGRRVAAMGVWARYGAAEYCHFSSLDSTPSLPRLRLVSWWLLLFLEPLFSLPRFLVAKT